MIEPFRTLRWSAWLGWQIESNWADLKLFVLYLVVKPISGSLVLVCMFFAAKYASELAESGGSVGRVPIEFLPYVYVSNACYGLVSTIMFGMSYVVISDRESYRMLKYIFISPAQFQAYFVGRGLARFFEGFVGGVITILAGLCIPIIRDALPANQVNVPLLLVYLSIGTVMLWSCGMILASAMLNMSRSGMFLSDGIAGVVYFLSGVVFPISILPSWCQVISMALPTTYWLEGMRRSLIGRPPEGSPLAASPLNAWDDGELIPALAASTVVLVVVSQLYYRRSLERAWRNGKLEETSGV